MKNVCKYCGKVMTGDLMESEFCSDECKDGYESFADSDRTKIKRFTGGIISGTVVMIVGIFVAIMTDSYFMTAVGIAMLGLTLILTPVATPETVEKLGYKKSGLLVRISGIPVVLLGFLILYLTQ